MGELRLLLLGGATASGKTTSGTAIAARLDASCVSADAIWQALRAATTRESHPAFHYFEPSEDEWRRGPDFLCARHIECAETMSPPLDAAIDFELHQRHPLVFEGAWITPEMAAAVSKVMRNQDLIAVAHAITVTSAFRTTIGRRNSMLSTGPFTGIPGISWSSSPSVYSMPSGPSVV